MTTAYESGRVPEISLRHRLRIAREEAGLEQQSLAERMGVSRNTVSAAEKGKNAPRKVVLNAWALATGFDVKWLETGIAPQPGPEGDDGCARRDSNPKPSVREVASVAATRTSSQVIPLPGRTERPDSKPAVAEPAAA
ncbi:immunity repressor [Gordonia phage Phlop]|uniref:Immunity repressor n=11 Tax=Wizardvirus TaxID=2169658 RepID=A0A7D5JFM4_9CAUD|nr:transcriptional repressor [Gordonia phage KimmyK]YP_010100850.1 transcriptional repressor [Gordonia phage Mutzi]YP_010102010.1 transcriptional repressor [Gordonia phage SmokingBunny]YP_010102108.1 transcriptional repressor [Gordonia phage VanDeWege]YP_010102203.1 transcriptional repressor [Gordonia phage Barb]YP_010102395.1 transcriptional repressor [Gordonia phage Valary]YP_010103652.1 transcriptional repressor [Gordonia phage Nubi]YP_010107683.1 transcriptional repressor [Gordonia phage